MNVSQIERDLYSYLGPATRDALRRDAELQDYLDALELVAPNECPNCGNTIGDHESFCGDECRREYMEEGSIESDGCFDRSTEPRANKQAGAVKDGQ